MKDDIETADRQEQGFVDKLWSGLRRALPPGQDEPESARPLCLLVALSGGADSTALLLGLKELSKLKALSISACHVNHKVRGPHSDDDQSFCEALCRKLEVPLIVKTVEVENLPRTDNGYSEDVLRERRYALLQDAAREGGFKFVVTAHVHEDQLETILFRLFRGSSLRGLTGMRVSRELADGLTLLRPLLRVLKSDCLEYVKVHGISARQDQSNEDTAYARNYLRHKVLPKILSRFPNFLHQLSNLRSIIQAEEEFWHELTAGSLEALSLTTQSENMWSLGQFRVLPLALKRRVIAEAMRERAIEVSFARVDSVIELISSSTLTETETAKQGALTLSPTWTVRVSGGHVKWVKSNTDAPRSLDEVTVRVPGINMALACGKVLRVEDLKDVKLEEIGDFPDTRAFDVLVDLTKARPPLILRSRRQGDVITPFGMQVSVSLKKYLHTHKPKGSSEEGTKFERIPLLADQDEVLWVPGVGISEKLRAQDRPSHRLSWLDIAADEDGLV
jgi:tRNA(Ile)-lysidine synthase